MLVGAAKNLALEKPLQPNYAFGLSLEIEDVGELLSELEGGGEE